MRYINATPVIRSWSQFAILDCMKGKASREATRKPVARKRKSARGRPPAHEVATRAENLIDVATEVFLDEGFKGASMSEIARRAGASKQTLYARYPSKAALFAALVERKASHLFEAIGPLGEGRGLRDTLIHCGTELLDLILSKDARGVHRVVIAECNEFPELGQIFWDRGPGRVRAMLADYLRAQQKLGNIEFGEPEQAVEILLGLLVSGATLRVWLGLPLTFVRTPAQRKAWVHSAVDVFLSSMEANARR
jgi:TetR/AcrR family transcriptional regulator, mexJK operon transcriptional repressor